MCQRVTCRTCGKATYQGCGKHAGQVLAGVPQSQRCGCPPTQKRPSAGLLTWLRRSKPSAT
jgi:hypothetical protein